MGVYIGGMTKGALMLTFDAFDIPYDPDNLTEVEEPHGDLIDMNKLRSEMYHEAFETDSKLQKWDSGCWIRYKMFENHTDNAKILIPAEVD